MVQKKDTKAKIAVVFILYIVTIVVITAILIIFRQKCLKSGTDSFITSYCLSDTHARTIIAAILTVTSFFIALSVSDAIDAYRTWRLETGINEGAYIAMTPSASVEYKMRSLRKKYGIAVLIATIIAYAPGSLQTLANLGITTVQVYVKNHSTATVYDAYSYYNTTLGPVTNNYGSETSALNTLSQMGRYSSSANSILVNNNVITNVVRDGYLVETYVVDGDTSNSFKRIETVATISTNCTTQMTVNADIITFLGPQSKYWILDYIPNVSIYAYNVTYSFLTRNNIIFKTTFTNGLCSFNCTNNTIFNTTYTSCLSNVLIQDHNIIYTVSTENVKILNTLNQNTTVDLQSIGLLASSFSESVDKSPNMNTSEKYKLGLSLVYSAYPQGLFNNSHENILHNKLCSAMSNSLEFLWSNYKTNNIANDRNVTLYNIVMQTHISSAVISIIAASILLTIIAVCVVGIILSVMSKINIKSASDNALMYNMNTDTHATIQQANVSNDPSGQCKDAFTREIYCSVIHDKIIMTSYKGQTPTKSKAYN